MASKVKHIDPKGFWILILLTLQLKVALANIDCKGQSFHCTNLTHFMICVDLGGGVSRTVDDFVIPCPPSTICKQNNRFECEFPDSTDLPTDATYGTTVTSVTTSLQWENIGSTVPRTSLEEHLELHTIGIPSEINATESSLIEMARDKNNETNSRSTQTYPEVTLTVQTTLPSIANDSTTTDKVLQSDYNVTEFLAAGTMVLYNTTNAELMTEPETTMNPQKDNTTYTTPSNDVNNEAVSNSSQTNQNVTVESSSIGSSNTDKIDLLNVTLPSSNESATENTAVEVQPSTHSIIMTNYGNATENIIDMNPTENDTVTKSTQSNFTSTTVPIAVETTPSMDKTTESVLVETIQPPDLVSIGLSTEQSSTAFLDGVSEISSDLNPKNLETFTETLPVIRETASDITNISHTTPVSVTTASSVNPQIIEAETFPVYFTRTTESTITTETNFNSDAISVDVTTYPNTLQDKEILSTTEVTTKTKNTLTYTISYTNTENVEISKATMTTSFGNYEESATNSTPITDMNTDAIKNDTVKHGNANTVFIEVATDAPNLLGTTLFDSTTQSYLNNTSITDNNFTPTTNDIRTWTSTWTTKPHETGVTLQHATTEKYNAASVTSNFDKAANTADLFTTMNQMDSELSTNWNALENNIYEATTEQIMTVNTGSIITESNVASTATKGGANTKETTSFFEITTITPNNVLLTSVNYQGLTEPSTFTYTENQPMTTVSPLSKITSEMNTQSTGFVSGNKIESGPNTYFVSTVTDSTPTRVYTKTSDFPPKSQNSTILTSTETMITSKGSDMSKSTIPINEAPNKHTQVSEQNRGSLEGPYYNFSISEPNNKTAGTSTDENIVEMFIPTGYRQEQNIDDLALVQTTTEAYNVHTPTSAPPGIPRDPGNRNTISEKIPLKTSQTRTAATYISSSISGSSPMTATNEEFTTMTSTSSEINQSVSKNGFVTETIMMVSENTPPILNELSTDQFNTASIQIPESSQRGQVLETSLTTPVYITSYEYQTLSPIFNILATEKVETSTNIPVYTEIYGYTTSHIMTNEVPSTEQKMMQETETVPGHDKYSNNLPSYSSTDVPKTIENIYIKSEAGINIETQSTHTFNFENTVPKVNQSLDNLSTKIDATVEFNNKTEHRSTISTNQDTDNQVELINGSTTRKTDDTHITHTAMGNQSMPGLTTVLISLSSTEQKSYLPPTVKYMEATTTQKVGSATGITSTEAAFIAKDTAAISNIDKSEAMQQNTPAFDCKNRKIGSRYAVRDDCRKFYTCNELDAIVDQCPGNTVFSDFKKKCTKDLSHCIRDKQFKCVADGRFYDYLEQNVYYICVKNTYKNIFVRFKFQCQNGYHLNRATVKCELNQSEDTESVPTAPTDSDNQEVKQKIYSQKSTEVDSDYECEEEEGFSCANRKSGRYADDNDCGIFYTCYATRMSIGRCPLNTTFSDIKKKCTTDLSHCVRNKQFMCMSDGRFYDYYEQNVYYICVKNKYTKSFVKFKFQCQNGYILNKTSVKCELSKDVSKEASNVSKDTDFKNDSNKKSVAQKKSNDDDFECEKTGKFPDANNCQKYYICSAAKDSEEFRRRKKKCDSDEVFNKDQKECVDAESYECVSGQ